MSIPAIVGLSSMQPNDIAVATDKRYAAIDPWTTDDQTDKLQWWLNQVAQRTLKGKYPFGYLPPCQLKASAQLTIDNSNAAKPIYIAGAGAGGDATAPSVIQWTGDPGDGQYAVDVTSQSGAPVDFGGIALIGSQDGATPGVPQWACRGLHVNGRMHVWDTTVIGFRSGVTIDGDHHFIEWSTFHANSHNIEVPPNATSQGDITFFKVRAGSATLGAIGVAASSAMAGWQLLNVELSNSPFCIVRFDDSADGGVGTVPNWLIGLIAQNIATENTANGVVDNRLTDGAGITGVKWDSGVNSNLYATTFRDPNFAPIAAWFNDGAISDVRFPNAFPSTATPSGGSILPSMKARSFASIRGEGTIRGGYSTALVNGARYFELTTATNPVECSLGRRDGEAAALLVPFRLTGATTVNRGEIVTNDNELGVKRYDGVPPTGVTGAGRAVGLAMHTATTGQLIHCYKAGNESDIQAKNTSGATIKAGSAFKPHSSGGVQACAWSDAEKIGRMLHDTDDAALGQVEILIP